MRSWYHNLSDRTSNILKTRIDAFPWCVRDLIVANHH